MSRKWPQLQKQLLRQIGSRIAEHGFKANLAEQTFYSRRPSGWAALHLSFIPHGEIDLDVTADAAVRFDAVEQLVKPDSAVPKSERGKTATVGGDLGNLKDHRHRWWTVSSEADVERVASEIAAAFIEIGIPYIDAFSDPEHVLSVLTSRDERAWLHLPFSDLRWMTIISLAWTLGRFGELDRLIKEGEHFLRSRNEQGLDRFLELATKLRALRPLGQ
jgi:hypothetical protein